MFDSSLESFYEPRHSDRIAGVLGAITMSGPLYPKRLHSCRTSTLELFRMLDIDDIVIRAVNEKHRASNLEKAPRFN